MRTFSANVQTALANPPTRVFTLVDLHFSSSYYLTDLPYNITIDGVVYVASSVLVEIDAPRNSSILDRSPYRIVLSDLDNAMTSEIRNNILGKDIQVRIGFFDASNNPLTDPADIVTAYKGRVDKPQILNDFETKYAVIEGTSPMADLDSTKPMFVSKDGMDQVSSTDTSFDKIYENAELEVKWGKK